ncbi:aspartate/glutamate racemase family protein [Aminivibrio sp.]|uniref:aspartate/glutamate racemase family protein n=1 Tax=Aminivibrio sp. TaxID=1872489 RepID=UPI00345EBD84
MGILKFKGRPFYGQAIGILMMDSVVPRIPGDIGNAFTFDFPVRYRVVKGATVKNIIHNPDRGKLDDFLQGAKELEAEGVRAITTSCGFLCWFQEELAAAVDIPVFTSSLLQIPMVWRMLGKKKKIGVLAANSSTLSPDHLAAVGVTSEIPLVLCGADKAPAFNRTFAHDGSIFNFDEVCASVVKMVSDMLTEEPDIGAIVCEGSNFAIFRHEVQKETGIPFFDIVTMTKYIHNAVMPSNLPEGWF